MLKRIFSLKMNKKCDGWIVAASILLLLLGYFMLASISVGASQNQTDVVINTLLQQFLFIFASYYLMTLATRLFARLFCDEVKVVGKKNKSSRLGLKPGLVFVAIIILLMLMATLFFTDVNGSSAWIKLGGFTLQPSEFAKIMMIVLFGYSVLDLEKHKRQNVFYVFRFALFFLAFSCLIIMLQPDFGTLVILVVLFALMALLPSDYRLRNIQKLIIVVSIIASIVFIFLNTEEGLKLLEAILGDSYQYNRFASAINPFADIYGNSQNILISIYAIASGGITGLGFGNSEQKLGYLFGGSTDFAFSVTMEELGLIGLVLIVSAYCIIIGRLFYHAIKCKREGYKVILMGIAIYLTLHFVINVGGVSGLIPLTGVPLLFLSDGNSALFSVMIALGIAQSIISMNRNLQETTKKEPSGVEGS